MKHKFEITLMGLLRWELKDRSRKQDILKIIDSFSEKGDRKAARLKRVVTKMLNEDKGIEENMIREFNDKITECTEVHWDSILNE